jgi:hypothetical protein
LTVTFQITSQGSHIRGELKTKVKPIIEYYGFESGQDKCTIKRNRELSQELSLPPRLRLP